MTIKPCICEHTEIVLLAARRCFSIILMISRADGSKRDSTSELSIILNKTRKRKTRIHLPRELQLARPDIEFRIFVSCCTKLDIRWFIGIGEPMLSCLVKTIGHQHNVFIIPEFRPAKFFCKIKEKIKSREQILKITLPLKKSPARRLTNTDPWRIPEEIKNRHYPKIDLYCSLTFRSSNFFESGWLR